VASLAPRTPSTTAATWSSRSTRSSDDALADPDPWHGFSSEVPAQLGLQTALAEARLGHQLVQALLSRCDCYTEPLIRSLETARRVNNILQQREGSFGKHIIIVERPARARLRHTYPVSALKRADVPVPEF
jgi:hypothetical protein